MHLFLSPHLDDAVLSCGGLIRQLTSQGEVVVIRTFMAADPPLPFPDTPVIRDLHQRWQADDSPMRMRRAEDRQAAAVLGAEVEFLDILDCPYRLNDQGQAIYRTNDALFGDIHPDDPALKTVIHLPERVKQIYAPLGAGGHVDHKIVSRLARELPPETPICFYEEYPYGADSGEAARVTYHSGIQKFGSEAVQVALSAFERPLRSWTIRLAEADIAAKINAIAQYASQISTFWDSVADMGMAVRRYALQIEPVYPPGGERLWEYED
jgi:LmbE family N-acetylglucosaminyl deacetylase